MLADVRPIGIGEARVLRQRILRPHQQLNELVYDGDDAADTLHLGAFERAELVSIASVMRESPPGEQDERAWRIRGMATVPQMRGRGHGAALLGRCVAHAAEHDASEVWCTARATAVGFYRRFRFEVRGGRFQIPVIGTHFVMVRRLG